MSDDPNIIRRRDGTRRESASVAATVAESDIAAP